MGLELVLLLLLLVNHKYYLCMHYIEIKHPTDFINTDKITIGELVGKKIVLLSIWTHGCYNCLNTLPYLNDWYRKYKDKGLEIIGVHTPEFDYEKIYQNVEDAVKNYEIKYPVVLDNDFGTWQAYQNHYWPHKYLIDKHGEIVHEQIGEGGYTDMEEKIVQQLQLL